MENLIFSSAFLLGLAGSLHCFGMCGPIAFAIQVDRKNKAKMFLQNLLYQLGRISVYSLMGIFFGTISYGFSLAGLQRSLSILLGIIMILSVFLSKKKLKFLNFYFPFLSSLRTRLGRFLKKKDFFSLFITGVLNGLLPCGLVYAAIGGSLATGSVISGGFFMFFFGLGTIPLMFLTVMLGNFVGIYLKNKILRIIPFVVFFIGSLLIIRGLDLEIAYLSPSKKALNPQNKEKEKLHTCH